MTADTSEPNIDSFFIGARDVPRLLHVYPDEVAVEILNVECSTNTDKNGARIFYKGRDGVLAFYPGYSIQKYVLATDEATTDPESTAAVLTRVISTKLPANGYLCLSNDGPLLLVFKILGQVRLHMMRSAAHGFDEQFIQDFALQYSGAKFEDLFPASMETASQCHIFRQGSRTTAMETPQDMEGRTMIYMGSEEVTVFPTDGGSGGPPPQLIIPMTTLSIQNAVEILRTNDLGLVCYRHEKGEVQILSEQYLQRIATMTGVSMCQLITGIAPLDSQAFCKRPAILEEEEFAKLVSSRFPRVLDLLSLYILCGTNPERSAITVDGFTARIDRGGRILATPRRGFYNFCRAAAANPKHEIPFPATPSSMRLAIRRMILRHTLPGHYQEVSKMFDSYEIALFQTLPRLIDKVLGAGRQLEEPFETAFGITAAQLLNGGDSWRQQQQGITGIQRMKNIRSSLVMADHYRLITVTRFAVRNSSELSATMRESHLISLLSDYSNSSRRRRQVAGKILDRHASEGGGRVEASTLFDGDINDIEEWPPLAIV